ncbi:hypothetical protein K3495_g16850, partial [Podosphaera aphanis]
MVAKDDSNRLIIAVDSNKNPASANTNEIVVVDPDEDPTLKMMTISQLKSQKDNTMAIQNYKGKLRPRLQKKEVLNTMETAVYDNNDQSIVVQSQMDLDEELDAKPENEMQLQKSKMENDEDPQDSLYIEDQFLESLTDKNDDFITNVKVISPP